MDLVFELELRSYIVVLRGRMVLLVFQLASVAAVELGLRLRGVGGGVVSRRRLGGARGGAQLLGSSSIRSYIEWYTTV